MLKTNLIIFATHILGCILPFLLIFAIYEIVRLFDYNAIVSNMMIIGHIIIMFLIYIAAGFFASDGKRNGIMPILSIFWLSFVLLIISIPILIYGFDIKGGSIADNPLESLVGYSMLANLAFYQFVYTDSIFSILQIPSRVVFVMFALFPSSLASLGFILKKEYIKRKRVM